ncbi:MAG: hypothetical protein IPK33_10680 [Gemmatimonadetes bacterium]|nr:hypothetical protein [Gemmatimonadota bacterium]
MPDIDVTVMDQERGGDDHRDGAATGRRPRSRSLRAGGALLAALHLLTACYTYVPPTTTLAPGVAIALDLTDEGRRTHTAALGPGILRVTGMLKGMEGDRYVLDVASVTPIRGQELPVSGVRVTLGTRDVTDVRVRTLSKKRTAWVVGSALAVVVTFIVTKGFRAGSTPPADPGGGGGPDQYRGSGGE